MSNFEITPEQREVLDRLADHFRAMGFEKVEVLDRQQDEAQREASFVQHLILTTAQREGEISNAND